jgi:hypothetical protein
MKIRAGLLGQCTRPRRILIGDCEKADRRMLRREPRAQCADPARAYDCDTQFFALHGLLPL